MNKRIIVLRRADMTDDDIARFLAKIDKGDDCWEWTAAASRNGYGAMGFHGKIVYAHRFAYALANGECANDLEIDHRCHNKLCVNPAHLQQVNNQQNQENRGARRGSRSGVRGVLWRADRNKWRVEVMVNGKRYYGGLYSDVHEAEKAAVGLRCKLMTNNLLDRKE